MYPQDAGTGINYANNNYQTAFAGCAGHFPRADGNVLPASHDSWRSCADDRRQRGRIRSSGAARGDGFDEAGACPVQGLYAQPVHRRYGPLLFRQKRRRGRHCGFVETDGRDDRPGAAQRDHPRTPDGSADGHLQRFAVRPDPDLDRRPVPVHAQLLGGNHADPDRGGEAGMVPVLGL